MTNRKKSKFYKGDQTERHYARGLRGVAEQVGKIVSELYNTGRGTPENVKRALAKYAKIIQPWAKAAAQDVVEKINLQDKKAWRNATAEMSLGLRENLKHTPVGITAINAVQEQVDLITSLPLEAAERVQKIVQEGYILGRRADDLVKEIMRTGEVTEGRARVIARTETSRIATTFTQARAEHIGSDGYIWRTAHDSDVRPSHKKMEGKFVRWDSPPTLDGLTGHAGCIPNCRCYPEPVLPETIE